MISIIIPAYNEEKRISDTLETYAASFAEDTEILVVLNGCKDNTEAVVKKYSERHPNVIRSITLSDAGKGLAIQKGFQEARGDIIGFVDADLATPIHEIKQMITILENEKIEGIIASRLLKGAVIHDRGFVRTIVSKKFAFLTRLLVDLPYADTQCGAKFFTRKAVQAMLPLLTAKDMTIDVDILLALHKKEMIVKEKPTEWYDKKNSSVFKSPLGLITNGYKMFLSLIALQRKYQ